MSECVNIPCADVYVIRPLPMYISVFSDNLWSYVWVASTACKHVNIQFGACTRLGEDATMHIHTYPYTHTYVYMFERVRD